MNHTHRLKPTWLFSLKTTISHLVALSNNRVIGVDNDLPWTLKKDLQHFSAYTQNKPIVMGRKTYESIGRPLPNRKNIVISRTMGPSEGLQIVTALNDAILAAESWNAENALENEVVLIGGGYVFRESMELVNKLVLTFVDCDIEGDIFYPEVDLSLWRLTEESSFEQDSENQYNFKVGTYLKN